MELTDEQRNLILELIDTASAEDIADSWSGYEDLDATVALLASTYEAVKNG